MVEELSGLSAGTIPTSRLLGLSNYTRGFLKAGVRVVVMVVIVLLAILVPSFDVVMGLLGSAMAFSICIVLPVAFYLKLFHEQIGMAEKVLDWFLVIVSSVLAIVGTVWVFLPKHVRQKVDGIN